jgi:NADPH:quinone reductase-like Zn-dependent oxidoreductase
MNKTSHKHNLLILGASGGVGSALLIYLSSHRESFGTITLLDKSKRLLANKFINHKRLDYLFLNEEITLPRDEEKYHRLLREHEVDIVLDVTDDETLPLFFATDKAGGKLCQLQY